MMFALPLLLTLPILVPQPWPVPNGDFQQATAEGEPAVWRHGFHEAEHYTFTVEEEDGNRFVRITGTEPTGRAYWSQMLAPVPAPNAFRVTFRYRGSSAGIDGFVRLRDGAKTDEQRSIHTWNVKPNSATWQTYEQVFAVPAEALAAEMVRAEIILYSRGAGATDYDDFALEMLDEYTPEWPTETRPLAMPYRPHDKMVCQQNPPDFSWPAVTGVDGYELQIARDPGFAAIDRDVAMVDNFHNFPNLLEPRVYWWRVRGTMGENRTAWSAARRFRINPDAWPFPVPPIDDLIRAVPEAHPRIWTTPATVAEFRARAEGPRKTYFENLEANVKRDIANPPAPEPTFEFDRKGPLTAEWIAAHNRLRGAGEGAASRLQRTAFAYLLGQDPEIGRSAVDQLMNLANWDADGATSYAVHDQVHRAISYRSAMAYDWLHDLLTPEQRAKALAMIETRTNTMFTSLAQNRPLKVDPYESHGWTAFGYIGIIALATLHDLPQAETWFREVVPTYLNLCPPWGDEDGGWIQGTAYWRYSAGSNKEFYDPLLSATGLSLYDKAYSHNSALFPMYSLPHGSPRAHFGDGNQHQPGISEVVHYRRLAQMHQNPVAQWAAQAIGDLPDGSLEAYFRGDDTLAPRPPIDLPRSRWFRDIGWVTMHSDLLDPARISLYFKSSWIGSFNHSHADQNSFVLNAYGEALAIDSGYYDWYGSPHDRGYTRQTVAHNAITHDGGQGQPIFTADYPGKILGFVTSPVLDATSGDATPTYQGALSRAVRHIVYVRPDRFVIVDELASDGAPRTYDWWLHALDSIEQSETSATVAKNDVRLDVTFHNPTTFTHGQRDEFVGPPDAEGKLPAPERPQGRGAGWPDQIHAWYSTAPLAATTLVATLQPYRAGDTPAQVTAQSRDGHLRLSYPTGERVWVRLPHTGEVNADGASFVGAIAAAAGESLLLVDGTRLEIGGRGLTADHPVTAVVASDRVVISAADDTVVRIRQAGIGAVRDGRGRELPPGSFATAADGLTLTVEPGSWTFLLNDTPAPGPVAPVELPVTIGDQTRTLELPAMRGVDGRTVAWGTLELEPGLYRPTALPASVLLQGTPSAGRFGWFGDRTPLLVQGTPAPLRLEPIGNPVPLTATMLDDPDQVRETASQWQEAETFDRSGGGSFQRYTHRTFLSGGVGVGGWDVEGKWLGWTIDVKKPGRYDLLLKAAGHEGSRRLVAIGDVVGRFETEQTPGYGGTPGEWRVFRVPVNVELGQRPVELTMWAERGLLNLDWVGLVASE